MWYSEISSEELAYFFNFQNSAQLVRENTFKNNKMRMLAEMRFLNFVWHEGRAWRISNSSHLYF